MYFPVRIFVLFWTFFSVVNVCDAEEIPLYVHSSNQVGVGTDSPSSKLHVVGIGGGSVEEVFRLESIVPPQQAFLNSGTGSKWFFAMTADDSFKVSFDGTGRVEARFRQNGNLTIAGSLTQNSDRNTKQNISEVDSRDILQRVVTLPISSWEYKAESGVTHLGPMAQDFYAAFGLGQSPAGISSIDTGGVALAAIQGLKREKDDQIKDLADENDRLQAKIIQLEMAVAELLRDKSIELSLGARLGSE